MSLKNKHAVVTGGGSGIGLAITGTFVTNGATVTIMGRNKERLDKVAQKHDRIHGIEMDVTNPESVKKAFHEASKIAPIDILINNAGTPMSAPFHKTSLEDWQRTIDVNLTSVFLTISACLEEIKASDHGRIINIASIAGLEGARYTAAYSASKHGVLGLTKSLALELGDVNTTINAVCPAFVNTKIVEQSIINVMEKTGRSHEEALKDILQSAKQSRLIEPEEVAQEVLELCDPSADNINGSGIVLDGN